MSSSGAGSVCKLDPVDCMQKRFIKIEERSCDSKSQPRSLPSFLNLPLSLFAAQTCVDETRVQEYVVAEGPQEPPYRLNCPLEPPSPLVKPVWQKDCHQLPAQDGKANLDFASVGLEDQANYTCLHQGNSTASFTLRLVVKGTYKCTFPPLHFVRGQR